MPTVSKSAPIGTLGLPIGDHWVRFHVETELVSFEIAPSLPGEPPTKRQPVGFVKKWGGTARKIEDSSDDWLRHINEKHLR